MPRSSLATKSNPLLVELIHTLKRTAREQEAPLWRAVAERLEKPTRRHPAVNLSRLERALREGETAVVPGKLLAAGQLTKPVTVAAWAWSEAARAKVARAGGRCVGIAELARTNPKGSGVRVVG